MKQEKFSTLEECCEFVRQLRWLTPAQILEQKDERVFVKELQTLAIKKIKEYTPIKKR